MKTALLIPMLALLFAISTPQVVRAHESINDAENAPGYWVPAPSSLGYDYPPYSAYDPAPPPGYYAPAPGPVYYGPPPPYYGPPVGIFFGFGFHGHHHH